MAGETQPATETATPAAEASAEVSLLDDGSAAAPAAGDDTKPTDTPTESKPADDKDAGNDAKTEGNKPESSLLDDDNPDEKTDGPAAEKPKGESEAYEQFTLPDGRELDSTVVTKATPVMKKLGLDQAGAQELVSLYDEMVQEQATAQLAAHQNLIRDWTKAVKNDPEFGGENLSKSRGLVRQAIAKFGGDAESQKQLLAMLGTDHTKGGWGIGNHPLIFGLLARAAAATSPDSTVVSDASAPANSAKQPWDRVYPNMKD